MPQVSKIPKFKHMQSTIFSSVGVLLGVLAIIYFFIIPTPGQAADRSEQLNLDRHYDQAIATLKWAQLRAWFKDDRILILSRLAATYNNKNDLSTSLDYYLQVEKLKPNDYSTVLATAVVAERAGNKTEAVRQYKLALDLAKKLPKAENNQDDTPYILDRLKELQ